MKVFTAGGTLNVTLMPGAPSPQEGDMFAILDFGSANGAFAAFNLPSLIAGLAWNTANLLISGILEVVAGLPGDYNGDGSVDAADYIVWRKNGGMQGEFNTWRANFGMSSGAGGGSDAADTGTVPEPTFIVIVFSGMLASVFRRRTALS